MKLLHFFLATCISISSLAQSKKAMSHEDMWHMKRVGAPILTPDGKYSIFSVQEASYNEKEQSSDLWIASTDRTEAPRKLTSMKGGESGYAISPDGKFLAFSAKRDVDEEAQIYLLPLKGGEAQRLTTISSGASNPKWSPDSKMILFNSTVYPGAYTDSIQIAKAKEKKDQKAKVRVYESFPIRNWDRWLDEKQSHIFVQNIDSTKATNLLAQVTIANELGFSLGSASWMNNNEVVLSATVESNTAAYQDPKSSIYVLNIKGGDAKKLLSSNNISFSSPRVSPDGKYLYVSKDTVEYKTYNLSKLIKYALPSLSFVSDLSTKLDRPINGYEFSGEDLLASVQDKGREKLFILSNGSYKEVSPNNKVGSFINVAQANGVIVANYEQLNMPPEVAIINNDGSHTMLTSFNKAKLAKLDMAAPETFWTKTSRGKEVRSMLIKPANFDPNKKYPLFVLMHGGPSISYTESFNFRWNPYVLASDDLVIVLTDYTGSTGYGEKFGQDIQNDPFKGPAQEINEAAADAIKRFSFIDGNKQVAGGASYGGHLANWMQATTTHYKCLVSHAGLMNSVSQWGSSDYIWGREVMNGGVPWGTSKVWVDQNPIKFAEKFKTPILYTVGEKDYRVPVNNTIEAWHVTQRLKIPSKLLVFPDENHWILQADNSKFHYKEIKDWITKWLSK
jgi:dipeptidyl aminopeptidase/acylaminoacyl peptidase